MRLDTASAGLGIQSNGYICIALWMVLNLGKLMVWCAYYNFGHCMISNKLMHLNWSKFLGLAIELS
jgi:hypothetical protein